MRKDSHKRQRLFAWKHNILTDILEWIWFAKLTKPNSKSQLRQEAWLLRRQLTEPASCHSADDTHTCISNDGETETETKAQGMPLVKVGHYQHVSGNCGLSQAAPKQGTENSDKGLGSENPD